jgi:predicted GNAT family acetyltransferase
VEVERVTGAAAILDRVEELMLEQEARHNLALGILSTALDQPGVYPEVRGWVVLDRGEIVGAALRTPPHNLVLGPVRTEEVHERLAGAVDDDLPGLVGTVPEVDAFACAWANRHDVSVSTRFDQRIYALQTVRPAPTTDGRMRLAGEEDRALLLDWISAFADEALAEGPSTDEDGLRRTVDARLGSPSGGFGLWEVAGRPVSLAGFGGRTPNGVRIGPVYTPPEHRNHGYGTVVTAAVSRLLLERGHRFCFLYTDLANPTSNSIYLRIGYEPVCDSRELAFSPRSA